VENVIETNNVSIGNFAKIKIETRKAKQTRKTKWGTNSLQPQLRQEYLDVLYFERVFFFF